MAADDLSAPLGQDQAEQTPFALPIRPRRHRLAGAWGCRRRVRRLGDGRRTIRSAASRWRSSPANQRAEAAARRSAARPAARRQRRQDQRRTATTGPPPASSRHRRAAPPGSKTVTIIDGSSGKRQEVVIPGDAETDPRNAKPPDEQRLPSRRATARCRRSRRTARARPRSLRARSRPIRRQAECAAHRDRGRRARHRREQHQRRAHASCPGR